MNVAAVIFFFNLSFELGWMFIHSVLSMHHPTIGQSYGSVLKPCLERTTAGENHSWRGTNLVRATAGEEHSWREPQLVRTTLGVGEQVVLELHMKLVTAMPR